MPTNTFQNLNPTKKDQIFEALLNEFSQYKLSNAQVARIIKECGIARGSFYKYFKDINDSYRYTLKVVLDEVHFDIYGQIKNEKQNTLNAFYNSTAEFINQVNDSKYHDFYRLYVQYNQYILHYDKPEIPIDQIDLIVNGKVIQNNEDIKVTFNIATMASHETIKRILLGNDVKQTLSDLKRLFEIINAGLMQRSL